MELKNLCIGGMALLLIIFFIIGAFGTIENINYEKKTVELFEDGTTMTVPATLELVNTTTENMLIGKQYTNSDGDVFMQAIKVDPAYTYMVDTYYMPYVNDMTSRGELQDNGLYRIPSEEGEKTVYVGVIRNDSIGETITVVSANETCTYDMINSVEWK